MSFKYGRHIFISYSREDTDLSEKMNKLLWENGYYGWIDRSSLTPGTQNWQIAIRKAIHEAYAVVFLASPSSGISQYVGAELALAKAKNIPIIPIWVKGETWIDCVPLDMVHSQYTDSRDSTFDHNEKIISAINQALLNHLPKHEALSERGYSQPLFVFDVSSASGDPIAWFNLLHYNTIGELLNDLYLGYLQYSTPFPPYTYGSQWILMGRMRGLLVPWDFLTQKLIKPVDRSWFASDINQLKWVLGEYSTDYNELDEEVYFPAGYSARVTSIGSIVPVGVSGFVKKFIFDFKPSTWLLHILFESALHQTITTELFGRQCTFVEPSQITPTTIEDQVIIDVSDFPTHFKNHRVLSYTDLEADAALKWLNRKVFKIGAAN